MEKRNAFLRTVLLLSVASAAFLYVLLSASTPEQAPPLVPQTPQTETEDQLHYPTSTPAAANEPAPDESEPASEVSRPSLKDLREEVEANPHQTPATLIRFAREASEKMRLAKSSEKQAKSYFGELAECVQTGEGEALQAFCLGQAQELANRYPGLEKRLGTLKKNAPARVSQLWQAAQVLGGG